MSAGSPDVWWVVAVYLGLAVLTGAVSFNRRQPVTVAAEYQRRAWNAFVNREAVFESYPGDANLQFYSKRILMPALTAGVVQVSGLDWPHAFSLLRLGLIFATYIAFHHYLRGWFPTPVALSGTFFMAATLPLTFKDWWEIPTDFPEILAFTLGMWCIREQRLVPLLPTLTLLGTLNRESAVLLPVLLLITRRDRNELWRALPWAALSGAAWLVVVAFVQYSTGFTTIDQSVRTAMTHFATGIAAFARNLNPYNNFLFYGYLFGAFWILPFARWRRLPALLCRALLIVPLHLATAFFYSGGRVDEPRHLCPLYPILVPAALFALFARSPSGLEGRRVGKLETFRSGSG